MGLLTFQDWTRADIISSLALLVSSLALIASGVSALVAWLGYRSNALAFQPTARAYFEPFESGTDWWLLHIEIHNRSLFLLQIERIEFRWPSSFRFSSYMGGFSGVASNGGPMMYSIPEQVHSAPKVQSLTARDIENITWLEVEAQSQKTLAPLIVQMPKHQFWRPRVRLKILLIQQSPIPRTMPLTPALPLPTRETVRHRY